MDGLDFKWREGVVFGRLVMLRWGCGCGGVADGTVVLGYWVGGMVMGDDRRVGLGERVCWG